MKRSMGIPRALNYFFAAIFLLFAALQYNDPDPWLWIPIYGYAALVCYLYGRGRKPQRIALGGMLFCFIYAAVLLMKQHGVLSWAIEHDAENLVQTMKATKPWVENTREFGGLLIIILALGLNFFRNRPARAIRKETSG